MQKKIDQNYLEMRKEMQNRTKKLDTDVSNIKEELSILTIFSIEKSAFELIKFKSSRPFQPCYVLTSFTKI